MDKEKAKVAILSQFRDERSAIRTLMMVSRTWQKYSGDTYFRDESLFFSKQLDMLINIHHVSAPDGKDSFQIAFEDAEGNNPHTPYLELLDVEGERDLPTIYTQEALRYVDSEIHFFLDKFQLREENGIYSYLYWTRELLDSYDLNTFSFIHGKNIQRRISELTAFIGDSTHGHIRYVFSGQAHQELTEFLDDNGIEPQEVKRILDAFRESQTPRQRSPFAYILNEMLRDEYNREQT